MPNRVTFVPDPAAWKHEFKSWNGVVGKDMRKRVVKGVILAKTTAPRPGNRPRNRTGINYATGGLVRQILPGQSKWGAGDVEGRVIAASSHALYVHEGTKPHPIPSPAKAATSKTLKFFWGKAGGIVYMAHVNHPGTRAIPFLREHLRALVR